MSEPEEGEVTGAEQQILSVQLRFEQEETTVLHRVYLSYPTL